ncbi:MAG: TonB-dependent receptor [Chitinophagaceae bacterium]
MKKIQLLFVMLFFVVQTFAQTKTLSGKVTDRVTGSPLSGVSITITRKGASQGVQTSSDGSFSIAVPENVKSLSFSYIGYTTTEVSVRDRLTIDVSLSTEEKKLDEVVVVAYGSERKKDITSAISTVDEKTIRRQQVTTVAQALQGTASGVMVVNNNGQPGENPEIRIRGIASINASAEPLIVLDGVPFDGNLNAINPNDIETFSVLKDATATALYGSRAAAGVILITTKSGRKGQAPSIEVTSVFGASSRSVPPYSFVNSQQLFELSWEGLKNLYTKNALPNPGQMATDDLVEALRYNPYNIAKPVGIDGKLVSGAAALWNTDWQDELTNNKALRKDINVGISGGSDKSRYFVSGGYLGQEGYLVTSKFQRVTSRINYTTDVKDWLQLSLKSSVVYSDQNFPVQSTATFNNVVQYIQSMSSIYPVYQHGENGELLLDDAGKPIYDFGSPIMGRNVNQNRNTLQPSNLVASTLADKQRTERLLTNLNVAADVSILKNLKFRSNFGIDRSSLSQLAYGNPVYGNAVSVGGRVSRTEALTTSWTWNNMLNYRKILGDHTVDIMGSVEAYKYAFRTLTASKTGLPFEGLYELSAAALNENTIGNITDETITSYLTRVKYDFKGKYFVEATGRWDGSSRFPENSRWGFFPAAGASWVITEEPFMGGLKFIGLLKLRGSYGFVGNKELNEFFPYLNQYTTGYDDLTNPGIYLTVLGNGIIQWEKQGNLNIGIDAGLFNNRLSVSVDYFNKRSIDLLFAKPLVLSGGIPSIDDNVGTMVNKGIEFSVNGAIMANKNFNWDIGFNITWLKNKITRIPGTEINNLPTNNYKIEVGRPYLDFFMPTWAGVDPANGDPLWYADEKDANGNPTGKEITVNKYDLATRRYQGSAIPRYTGGFRSSASYKKLELNVLLNFSLGGKFQDNDYDGLMHGLTAGYGSQLHSDILRRWQKVGDITNVPRLDEDNNDINNPSSRYLFKGDCLRLRNVTLSYNAGNLVSGTIISAARIFVQADNYLTWSKLKKGTDPEVNVDGRSRTTSSPFKTISAGINITL